MAFAIRIIAFEWRVDKDIDDALDHIPPGKTFRERKDVCIVVHARKFGRKRLRYDRASDAGHFVRGDGDADTRATDHDATIGGAGRDRLTDGEAILGIVARRARVRSKIENLMPIGAQHVGNFVFVFVTGVIGTERDFHGGEGLSLTVVKAGTPMKLACSSSAFDRALQSGELTQLEFLDHVARELRADGVVLDVRHFPRIDDDYLAQIKKMAADVGLTIAAIASDEFFIAGPEKMREFMRISVATGAPLLTGRLAQETALAWSAQLERLADATSLAKKQNITLAVRNAPGTFAATSADCKRVTKEADSAWLRFGLEPGALDGASDPAAISDRTVLLWAGTSPGDLPERWSDYAGFTVIDKASGDAQMDEIKIAIRSWRTAISQLNRN